MGRTLGIILISLLIGIGIGSIGIHQHHQSLWKKRFDERKADLFEPDRGNGPRMNRLPREVIDQLGSSLLLPEPELAPQVESLPLYQRLSFEERAKFMENLHQFRVKQIEISNDRMKRLDLTLNEEEQKIFRKSVLEKFIKNKRQVRNQSQKLFQELEQKTDVELIQEFKKK